MCLDVSPERLAPRASRVTPSSNLPSSIRLASASTDTSLLMEDAKRYVAMGKCSTTPAMTATRKVEMAVLPSAKSRTNTNATTKMPQLPLFALMLENI
jgi:hypothetical protein